MLLMVLGVVLSLLGLLSCSSPFFLWAFIVLGTLCLTSYTSALLPSSSLILFFAVSELGSLLFLLGSILVDQCRLVLALSLLLKLGFAPFQFWVYPVLSHLSVPSLFFVIGPSKLGLLHLFVSVCGSSSFLCFLCLLVGLNILFLSTSLNFLLYASGSVQLLFLVCLGPLAFFRYYFSYLTAVSCLVACYYSLLSPLSSILSLSGLPPLAFFWGKVYALSVLPFYSGCLLLAASCLSLFPYLSWALLRSSSTASSPTLLSLLTLVSFARSGLFS